MPAPRFQATIREALPLGERLLLSVEWANTRPALPCRVRVEGTPHTLLVLEMQASPTLWLLGQLTLIAEASAGAEWRSWPGRTLLAVETET